MKKAMILILLCLILAGCGTQTAPVETASETTEAPVQIANPWVSYDTLAEAEAAAGLTFPLPETVAGSYIAESFRVMNGQLLEVVYRDDEFEVTVRMEAGEGQDLSGVYETFEKTVTFKEETYTITHKYTADGGVLQLISKDGYSYSLYAPIHYWGDSAADFLAFLND